MDIFILMGNSISHGLISISSRLSREVGAMSFASPVSRVYNPLDYAFSVYREYLERFVPGPGGRIFLGMNPGPWGMAQTGIPFGAVPWVRDWMKNIIVFIFCFSPAGFLRSPAVFLECKDYY